MSFTQKTLRSFLNADGKLVLCNELFFDHFGHCTQHLIGRSVTDVFSLNDGIKVLQALEWCHLHPNQSCTLDMQKQCKEGCNFFRWEIFAEQQNGKVTGVHLVGRYLGKENLVPQALC